MSSSAELVEFLARRLVDDPEAVRAAVEEMEKIEKMGGAVEATVTVNVMTG